MRVRRSSVTTPAGHAGAILRVARSQPLEAGHLWRLVQGMRPARVRTEDQQARWACDVVRAAVAHTPERGEVIYRPAALLEVGAGDCDDATALLASLLEGAGYSVRVVFGGAPAAYQHVWLEALAPNGVRWVPLDPSTDLIDTGASPVSSVPMWVSRWR